MRVLRWMFGTTVGRLIVACALALLVIGSMVAYHQASKPQSVPLSQAMAQIDSGQITSAQISDSSQSVTLTTTSGQQIQTNYPASCGATITKALLDHNVDTTTVGRTFGTEVLFTLLNYLPFLLLIAVIIYFAKAGLGGRMRGGKALAEVPQVTFADVAGCDEAVADLKEITQFLADPERFHRLGATLPRGALLSGPPGTGKTLLARAVAGEAGVPFYAVAGSDFVEMFAGRGASRVRKLFDEASKSGKAIVFIDEIDAVGRQRSSSAMGSSGDSERESTLIALLAEMDGFERSGVIVLAATNRPDMLDEALTRPGRLDRQIPVNAPDRRGRVAILRVHTRNKLLADDVDLGQIAALTPGMVGAELSMVVNEACIEAARRDADSVTHADFTNAVQLIQIGRARTSALVTERDRQITAYHEAGHAVAATLLPNVEGPSVVSIIPRGQSGGATYYGGTDDNYLTVQQARDRLVVMMGGRAAEMLLLGPDNYSQGASHDIESGTRLATAMITRFGMADGQLAAIEPDALRLGGELATATHATVNTYLLDALEQAKALLHSSPGRDLVERLVAMLLEEETVYRDDILALQESLPSLAGPQ